MFCEYPLLFPIGYYPYVSIGPVNLPDVIVFAPVLSLGDSPLLDFLVEGLL
jgi:hypothetical protein